MLHKVYEPIEIGHVDVANRIVAAAHGTALSRPRLMVGGEDFIAYHVARAKGGVGLTVLRRWPSTRRAMP
jgi:2,4-dienoyl-CoA reductase-like NADH-dependent reductase (Old Yellow Enzyme family)